MKQEDILLDDHLIRITEGDFKTFTGSIYPILWWVDLKNDKKEGWSFRNPLDGGTTDVLSEAVVMFEFSFCWRGVWEGRVYFKQEEYWSEEIAEMNDIWNQIEPLLKDKIKAYDPQPYPYYED